MEKQRIRASENTKSPTWSFCPAFNADQAKFRLLVMDFYGEEGAFVECTVCKARGPRKGIRKRTDDPTQDLTPGTVYQGSNAAVEAWNKRI